MVVAAVVAACGGGGGGGTAAAGIFAGTVAVGAPMAGGTVQVFDSLGASVGSATTAANGSYTLSFTPGQFTAPYVIVATGKIGSAMVSLTTVSATNGSTSANVTPLTHAISATLSSTGKPTELVADIATQRAHLTAANIANREQGFRDALAASMTAAGLASNFNLMTGTFSTALDKLLDNVHIDVPLSGGVIMSTSGGTAVDDLAAGAGTPAAVSVVKLAVGAVPSSANAASLPAPGVAVGIDVLENARLAFNACFAIPAPRSGNAACTGLFASSAPVYTNEGRTAAAELDALGADSGSNNMTFGKPQIVRALNTTPGAEKMMVKFVGVRTDGATRELSSVAAKDPVLGWRLVGDQRPYRMFINGTVAKRVSQSTPSNSRYETGLTITVWDDATLDHVIVTGPGLPGYVNTSNRGTGVTLQRKAGCDYLALASGNTAGTGVVPANGTTPLCTPVYVLRAVRLDGVTVVPLASYQYGGKTDAEIINEIDSFALYRFEFTKTDASTETYWNRLTSRPYTIPEAQQVRFPQYTAPATFSAYPGGAAPTISWTIPSSTVTLPPPAVYKVWFYHNAIGYSDYADVAPGAQSTTVYCSNNPDCSGANFNTGLTYVTYSLNARNFYGTNIYSQLFP